MLHLNFCGVPFQMGQLFCGEPVSPLHSLQPNCARGVHINAHQFPRTNDASKLLQDINVSKTIDNSTSVAGARCLGNDSMAKGSALSLNKLCPECLKAFAICGQPSLEGNFFIT